jgi:NAD(P)-dependent dehydrogenase (short-subunit alcohol dehydrogenase family)
MPDLTGKIALVTGAGGFQGIGRAIALRLARDGADVAVNDLSPGPAAKSPPASETAWGGLDAVVEEIRALGRRSRALFADVSDSAAVESMFRELIAHFGRVDILVNNAASRPGRDRALVVDLDEDAWDHVFRVNVRGSFLCSRAAARVMIQQGRGGKIVMLSSTKGKQGAVKHAAYAASKFAILGFAQSLALELAPYRINVNSICPGVVNTERLQSIAQALESSESSAAESHARMLEQRATEIPLGRIGEASDIANAAAFLASSESDYMTGASIMISGGSVLA